VWTCQELLTICRCSRRITNWAKVTNILFRFHSKEKLGQYGIAANWANPNMQSFNGQIIN
jgi:hypothetical protein